MRVPTLIGMNSFPRRAAALAVLCVGMISLPAIHSAVGAASHPPRLDASNAKPGDYGWFEAGLQWHGEFADPHIVKYHGVYYAYSSHAGGRYLGVQTSTDLVHWTIADRWSNNLAPWAGGPNPRSDTSIPREIRTSSLSDGDVWNLNDALVRPARWGLPLTLNGWMTRDYWAVGVTKIGSKWYAWAPVEISRRLADGTMDPEGFGRYCLTMATARSPLGPFRDVTGSHPYYCDSDPGGSIDPSPYVDPHTGAHYLTWKSAGYRGNGSRPGYPSALKAVKLDAHGRMTGAITTLLTTNQGSWEGSTVENPAMIRYHGRWYLFYSANSFIPNRSGHSNYATGYALCAGPMGPCRRISSHPIMSSTATETGMGGAQPFIDLNGHLALIYASFWLGEYRTNHPIHQPRRMHLAGLTRRSDNTLRRSW